MHKTNDGLKLWLPIHSAHVFIGLILYFIFNSGLYAHPVYEPWRLLSFPLFGILALFGIIPVILARKKGASFKNFPYFLILGLLYRRLPFRKNRPPWSGYLKHPIIRYRWALLILKCYFLPLMLGSFYNNIYNMGEFRHIAWTLPVMILFLKNALFIIDSLVATAGYTFESKRWGAPIKAVETGILAWFVCLICYFPASNLPAALISGRFWPQYRLFPENSLPDIAVSIIAAVFLFLYVWGIITQGLRFANLTYRGTTTNGPFSLVRHPQYSAKVCGWFFEWLPFFGNPINIFFYLVWVSIYVARALTEEKFLSQFEDYRVYKSRVKWRFIPKVW